MTGTNPQNCTYLDNGECTGRTISWCNHQHEYERAKQSLENLWSNKDANAQDSIAFNGMIQGLIGALGVVSVSGNWILMALSIALSVIAALPGVMIWINTHWHNPSWAVNLAPFVDVIAGVANGLNVLVGLVSFAFNFGAGDLAKAGLKLLMKGLSGIAYTVMSAVGMNMDAAQETLDQDQYYRRELANWSQDEVIAQCKAQGGASC